jgi:hypothetical protein
MGKQTRTARQTPLYDLRISIRNIEPAIWRRVIVWDWTTLDSLHLIIQELFGWQNYHLYHFDVKGVGYESPNPESDATSSVDIPLMELGIGDGDVLTYVYDFGDQWELDIRVLGSPPIDPDTSYPHCVEGQRAGPPDDSGGPHRYTESLKILANSSHPEFEEIRSWYDNAFDPEMFDLRAMNRILSLAFLAVPSNTR